MCITRSGSIPALDMCLRVNLKWLTIKMYDVDVRCWSGYLGSLHRQFYPKAPREELLKAIPTRNYRNMIYRAGVLGLVRQEHELETAPASVSWQDFQIMQ